jgi:hypothetical protein
VKRILTIGMALALGMVVGCGKDDGVANPKPANPGGNPGLKRDALPSGAPGGQPKASGALKD